MTTTSTAASSSQRPSPWVARFGMAAILLLLAALGVLLQQKFTGNQVFAKETSKEQATVRAQNPDAPHPSSSPARQISVNAKSPVWAQDSAAPSNRLLAQAETNDPFSRPVPKPDATDSTNATFSAPVTAPAQSEQPRSLFDGPQEAGAETDSTSTGLDTGKPRPSQPSAFSRTNSAPPAGALPMQALPVQSTTAPPLSASPAVTPAQKRHLPAPESSVRQVSGIEITEGKKPQQSEPFQLSPAGEAAQNADAATSLSIEPTPAPAKTATPPSTLQPAMTLDPPANPAPAERMQLPAANEPEFFPRTQPESTSRLAPAEPRELPVATSFSTPEPVQPQEPAQAEEQVYQVQPGDNYWTISRQFYGTARYFAALAEHNKHRISQPERMKPGMYVLIPDVNLLHESYPKLTGGNPDEEQSLPAGFFVDENGQPCYRVSEGDTLGDIAQQHLGRTSRWVQVYGMNKDRIPDPNSLKLGTVLRLPSDACQVARAPHASQIR